MTTGHADHVGRNRTHWDRLSTEYAEWAPRAWASDEATWGIWRLPERDLRALPEVAGKDVVELVCGTAYWSAWLARRGARVVGLDNSWCQLETARALRRTHGLDIPLVHADAERVPLRPPAGATTRYPHVTSTWARRWPSEEIWRLRKRP